MAKKIWRGESENMSNRGYQWRKTVAWLINEDRRKRLKLSQYHRRA